MKNQIPILSTVTATAVSQNRTLCASSMNTNSFQ
jgi:hypothetical protein